MVPNIRTYAYGKGLTNLILFLKDLDIWDDTWTATCLKAEGPSLIAINREGTHYRLWRDVLEPLHGNWTNYVESPKSFKRRVEAWDKSRQEAKANDPTFRARKLCNAVYDERARQIHKLGYDAKHDDQHTNFELRQAAAYILAKNRVSWPFPTDRKMTTPRLTRDELIKAAALCIAEIERIERKNERSE